MVKSQQAKGTGPQTFVADHDSVFRIDLSLMRQVYTHFGICGSLEFLILRSTFYPKVVKYYFAT